MSTSDSETQVFNDGKVIRGLTKALLREWWEQLQAPQIDPRTGQPIGLSRKDQRLLNKVEEKVDQALGEYGRLRYEAITNAQMQLKQGADQTLVNVAANEVLSRNEREHAEEIQDEPIVLTGDEITFIQTRHGSLDNLPGDREGRRRWNTIDIAISDMPGVKFIGTTMWIEGDPKPQELIEQGAVDNVVKEFVSAHAPQR